MSPVLTRDVSQLHQTDGAQSIRRSIKVIHVVASGGKKGLRLIEIASMAGLHVATTRRMLMTLVEEGILQINASMSTYTLGPQLLYLGQMAKQQQVILEPFRPYLEEIARRSGDTVLLSVRAEAQAVCLARIEGAFPIRTMTLDIGSIRPLGAGAGSLALLAWLPDAERERIIDAHADKYPKYSIDSDQVRQLISLAHRLGYALNDGLILDGISGIGIPIADPGGNIVAAISITAISSRLDQTRTHELTRMVEEVCRDIQFWKVVIHPRPANRAE